MPRPRANRPATLSNCAMDVARCVYKLPHACTRSETALAEVDCVSKRRKTAMRPRDRFVNAARLIDQRWLIDGSLKRKRYGARNVQNSRERERNCWNAMVLCGKFICITIALLWIREGYETRVLKVSPLRFNLIPRSIVVFFLRFTICNGTRVDDKSTIIMERQKSREDNYASLSLSLPLSLMHLRGINLNTHLTPEFRTA